MNENSELPLIVIEPTQGSFWAGLADVWRHRHLLFWLTWRDIRVRYSHAALGFLWAVFQPLALVVVLSLALSQLARFPTGGTPVPVFLLAGVALWTMFASVMQMISSSLQANAALVSKVYFPRLAVVLSAGGIPLMDFLVTYTLIFPVSFLFGAPISPMFPLSLMFVILALMLSIGVGLWLATLTTKYYDTRFIIPVILQAGMFASPVLYAMDLVPDKWRMVVALNPMVGILEGFRFCIFGGAIFDWYATSISIFAALLMLLTGIYRFQVDERDLIDCL